MKKLITLEEALRKGLIRNLDDVDPKALFPRKRELLLYTRETGKYPQVISRDDDKIDYFFLKRDYDNISPICIIGVSNLSTRNMQLILYGYRGFGYAKKIFGKISETLFSNKKLGVSAEVLTEQCANELFKCKRFKGFLHKTWLNTIYSKKPNCIQFEYAGIKYARGKEVFKIDLGKEHSEFFGKCDFCPMISLLYTKKILVVKDSMRKSGKWKLIPKKNLLLRLRYGLFG